MIDSLFFFVLMFMLGAFGLAVCMYFIGRMDGRRYLKPNEYLQKGEVKKIDTVQAYQNVNGPPIVKLPPSIAKKVVIHKEEQKS